MSYVPPTEFAERPYADPNHPGNRVRPRWRCLGCGQKGVITGWGRWCFSCNVKRLDRIGRFLEAEYKRYEDAGPKDSGDLPAQSLGEDRPVGEAARQQPGETAQGDGPEEGAGEAASPRQTRSPEGGSRWP